MAVNRAMWCRQSFSVIDWHCIVRRRCAPIRGASYEFHDDDDDADIQPPARLQSPPVSSWAHEGRTDTRHFLVVIVRRVAILYNQYIQRRLAHLLVGLSVGLSGGCTVAKWLIGSGCRLGWWSSKGRGSFGSKCGASCYDQWGLWGRYSLPWAVATWLFPNYLVISCCTSTRVDVDCILCLPDSYLSTIYRVTLKD